jgi:hypothetical protein
MSIAEKSPVWIAEKLPGFAWEQVRQVAVAPVCGCLVRASLLGEAGIGLLVIGREEGEVAQAVRQVEEKVQVLSGWIPRTDDVVGMETVLTDKVLTTAELQRLLAEAPEQNRAPFEDGLWRCA